MVLIWMSAKDSQFIERALVHPWMFWVLFWKWPRIVRQICSEYDLVARDRDAAKAAHEQAVAANEKVRKWIHVTHQLDATADLRAIWTAGKRLSILLAFFIATNAFGQAPPYLRNQWTTNANPIAVKVISTNGVQAATNVWELDFTNTTSVSVNVVSNAGKVVFSFIGATNSGGSGSIVGATNLGLEMSGAQGLFMGTNNQLIELRSLVPGTMILFSTNSTNITIIGTGQTGSENLTNWSNIATGAIVAGATIWTNDAGVIRLTTNAPVNVTNNFSVHADRLILSTNGWMFLYPTGIVNGVVASILKQMLTNGAFLSWQETPGFTTNCSVFVLETAPSFGLADFSDPSASRPNSNCVLNVSRGGFGLVVTSEGVTNLVVDSFEAGVLSCFFEGANNIDLNNGGGAHQGIFGALIDDFRTITSDGVFLGVEAVLAREIDISVADGSASFNRLFNVTNVDVTVDNAAIMAGEAIDSTNAWMRATDGSLLAVVLNLATNLAVNVANAQTGSIAVGIVTGAERLSAIGHTTGVGALAVGRDLSSTNNWTFGIHYTNAVPLSLAVGADGTTQFRAASNSVVIRSSAAPTVGQILTATDTDGTVGWSNAPSGSGGIASIYTNNVLAGGPGLTELGFTNTATVTATATTNAGRVTMSFSASTASAGGTNKQVQFNNEGALAGATNLSWDLANSRLGVNKANPTVTLDVSGKIQANDQISTASGASIGWNGAVFFFVDTAGSMIIGNATFSDWGTLAFGNRTAPFPGLTRTAGHLAMRDGTGANSTNSFIFGNTVNTTASTGMTMNRQTGRVRLSAGNQTYLVTNNLATANSIVTATINSDDTTALSVKAIPAAGMITLKANATTTADTDISFFISSP